MKIDSKPLRYAHAEGHTDVCYTDDGQHIITCGNDGDVRIWVDIEDDDPNSHCVGESALAVCYKEKKLYVATDNHVVQAYTYPAFDKDGIVTRFTAPVTQIKSTNKIEALGCTSENMEAKICNLEGGAPLFVMAEHKGPVLSIAICPHMKYACTACGDGKLRIWDIDTQKMIKEISCIPKINTFYAAKVLYVYGVVGTSKDELVITTEENNDPIPSTSGKSGKSIQQSIDQMLEKKKLWDINDPRAKSYHQLIAEMIAVDNMEPLTIVDSHIGFKRLLNKAVPQYQIPSRFFLTENVIPNIHDKVVAKFKTMLEAAENIAFTSNMWTCSVNNLSFLSVTSHWISENLVLNTQFKQ